MLLRSYQVLYLNVRDLNINDVLSIIGREGEPRKKDGKPNCFGTPKVLELNSDIQCIQCDSWKYSCLFQFKMKDTEIGSSIDFSDLDVNVGE